MSNDEIPLHGGNTNGGVVRVGETVRRHTSPQSPRVHALLRHLELQGFTAAPRYLGQDDAGREVLTYLHGSTTPPPETWTSTDGLIAAVGLLRRYHDATVSFVADAGEGWAIRDPDPARHEVICHNDLGPYNLIFDKGLPVAMIDFDLAGPGPRLRDLAYLAYWFVPLCFDREELVTQSWAELDAGCPRLRLICAEYGHSDIPALLDMAELYLLHLSSLSATRRAVGARAAATIVAQGHLAIWRAEYRALVARRADILACFA